MANIGRILASTLPAVGGAVIGGVTAGPEGAIIGALAGGGGGATLNALSRHNTRGAMGFDAWDSILKKAVNQIDDASGALQREYGRATRKFNKQWENWGEQVTSLSKKLGVDANEVMQMSSGDLAKHGVDVSKLKEGTFAGQRAFLLGDTENNIHIQKVRDLSKQIQNMQENIQTMTGRQWTRGKAAASTAIAEDNMFLPTSKSMVSDLTFESEFQIPETKVIWHDKKTGKKRYSATGGTENKKYTRHKELTGTIGADGTTTYTSRNYDIGKDGEKVYLGDAKVISKDKYEELIGQIGTEQDITTKYKGMQFPAKMKVSADTSNVTYIYNGGESAAYNASTIGLPQQRIGHEAAGKALQNQDNKILAAQIAQAKTGEASGGILGMIQEHPYIAMGIAAGGAALLTKRRDERQGNY